MFSIVSKYLTRIQLHSLNDNFSRVLRSITTREKFILDPIFFGFSPMRYSEHVFSPSDEQLEGIFCHFLEKQNINSNTKYAFFAKEIVENHSLMHRLSLFEHALKQTWFNNKKKGLRYIKQVIPAVEHESWWLHFLLDSHIPKKELNFRDWLEAINVIEKHAQKYPLVHNKLLQGLMDHGVKKEEIGVVLDHLPHIHNTYVCAFMADYSKNADVIKCVHQLLKNDKTHMWKVWEMLPIQTKQALFKDKPEFFALFESTIFKDVITGKTLDMNEEILFF